MSFTLYVVMWVYLLFALLKNACRGRTGWQNACCPSNPDFSTKQLGLGTTRNWSLIVSIRESATKIAWSAARRRLSRSRKPSRSSLARILRVKGFASIRENAFNRYTRPRARSNELSFFPFGFWVHMTDELFDSFLTVITHFPFSGTSCSVERWHFSFFADRVRIIATFR